MKVEFVPATAADLAEVAAAGAEFRRHWESFQNMQPTPAFVGGVADIDALGYLEYEGLGLPGGGLPALALVWGNVLAVQAGLRWVRAKGEGCGGLWLGGAEWGPALLWPYARLAESRARGNPQYSKDSTLMMWVVEELIEQVSVPTATHARLRRFQLALEVGVAVAEQPGTAVDWWTPAVPGE